VKTFCPEISQLLIIILIIVSAFAPFPASGAQGIKVKSVEAYPTFECIGLRLVYEGDSDSNAVANVRYRGIGKTEWRQALPLGRIKGNRFAGSIFFLDSGTDYEVEIEVTDPAGVTDGKRAVPVRTRSERFQEGGGREYYVDPAGADSGEGTAINPFRTIQKAVDHSQPGDIIWVLPGVYREAVEVRTPGREDAYIAIKALKKGVIISGADQNYEDLEKSGRWRAEKEGYIYSTAPGYETRYVAADGERLYHYLTRQEFDNFICGEPGGWYQGKEGKRLYVRLSSNENPDKHSMQIAARDAGFHIKGADYIIIEGFEIRDFGKETPGAGVHLDGAAWCVIRNCSIHGMNSGIMLSEPESEGNLVESCEIWDTSLSRWPWAMTKSRDEEGAGVMSFSGGRGNVVRSCRMYNLFDGLSPSNWGKQWTEALNCDWDVYDNEIFDIRDDVIEPEGPCINFRIWNNYCHDIFAGVSLAPINCGPTYMMYNVLHDHSYLSIKYNGVGPGLCYIFHNTIYTSNQAVDALRSVDRIEGQVFRNNIFCGDGLAINALKRPSAANDFDYDTWYNLDNQWLKSYTGTDEKRLFQFGGETIFSLKTLQDLFGWEMHGLYDDPHFVDAGSGNLKLKSDSPCIDNGQLLPNINDNFKGNAPDMGAYEWGSLLRGRFPLGCQPRGR